MDYYEYARLGLSEVMDRVNEKIRGKLKKTEIRSISESLYLGVYSFKIIMIKVEGFEVVGIMNVDERSLVVGREWVSGDFDYWIKQKDLIVDDIYNMIIGKNLAGGILEIE